jgi:hypothetical protein
MPSEPRLSPAIQNLIDKGLLDRLAPTFSTFFFEQFEDWELLFPAEQNYQERLFSLLDRSAPQEVDALFRPLREVEARMGVNEKTWPRRHFTLDQVEFLARNPHYQEWRQAIAGVFARIDPLLNAEVARNSHARLVIVTIPSEIPAGPDRMWLRLRDKGKRVPLDVGEGDDYLPALLAGGGANSIAGLYSKKPYDSWIISAGRTTLSGGVTLSYEDLKDYRSRLMSEVRRIVEVEKVAGPRQLAKQLKELKVRASEGAFAEDAKLAEFVRAVLLMGNGCLLINNTFVEWATVQSIRRARPSVVIVSFGIRNKLKPFTSMLINTDQDSASPIPNQMDVLGTYIDLEVFYQYIWQEFEKYPEYRNNTAYLFVGDGLEEMFCIAPGDFPLLARPSPLKLAQIFPALKEWLGI